MIDLKNYEKRKKELLNYERESLKDGPKQLRSLHDNEFDNWMQNAVQFKTDYPVEVAKFWAELFRSDFTLKFLVDVGKYSKPNLKDWNYKEKVEFIKNTFESIYSYFSFLTISINYSPAYIKTLREDWYIPSKAKEYSKRLKRPWKVSNKITSGKHWVLKNCKLFKYSPVNTSLISKIRNSGSHNKIIVTDEKVILLDEDKTREITKEIDNLSDFLLTCTYISYEFHLELLFFKRFWVYPSIVLTIPEKFNYEKRNVIFEILNDFTNNDSLNIKTKNKKISVDKLEQNKERLQMYFLMLAEFTIRRMWTLLKEEKDSINQLLTPVGLQFNLQKLNDVQKMSGIEIYNTIYFIRQKLRQIIFKEEVEILEITEENFDEIDFIKEQEDALLLLERILKLKGQEKKNAMNTILGYGLMGVIFVLISPIAKLRESFKELFIQK